MKIAKTISRIIASPFIWGGLSLVSVMGSALVAYEYVKSGRLLNG